MSFFARTALLLASAGLLTAAVGCQISPPFSGPGYANGEVTTSAEGPYFLAATHLILPEGDAEAREIFDENMNAINAVFEDQPGLIGYSFRTQLFGRDNWTVTVWESEEDAVAWVNTPVHVDAMAAMAGRAAGGVTAHWEVTEADLPPVWEDIQAKLGSDGREVY